MKKRLIAFLLVLIMVLGMLPVSAMAASNSTVVLHPSVNSTVTGVKVKVGDTISGHTVSTISGYDITVDLGKYNVNNDTFRLPYAKDIWEGVDNNKVDYISWAGSGSNSRSEGASALLANGKNTAYYYFKGATPTRYTYHLIHEFNYVGGTRWDIMATTAAESYQIDVNKGKPTRDRYKFDGWADTANATTAKYFGGELITLTKDNPTKTIYAVWKPIFELRYDANGGTGAPDSQTYTALSATSTQATFTVPNQTPTKEGYTFKGWADSATATDAQYQPGGPIAVKHENSPKTVYAVWEGSDPIPVPSYDDLKSAIGQIQVKDVSTPSCGTENYDLIDNTQSEPFNWTKTARLDQPGKYDVTIKTAPYVAKYNSEKSKTHELNNANQTTLKLVISYENNTWKLDDGLRVIEVKHSEQTPPTDKPAKPTENDVTGVVVDIVCVTTTGTHDTVQYPLAYPTDAQHTIGEVVSDGAGGYICPVTVRTAWFVQQASNLRWKVQHTPTAQTITFNLTYDKNSKTWVKPAANPRIEATHEVTPDTPGDQKPNIEEANAKIRVQCIEYPSKHNPYKQNYRILPDSYEDLGWDQTEYGYIYSIRLNRAKYIAQFDQEIGRPHTDTEPNKETRINWRWENGAWHLIDGPDGVTAGIKVKCAETPVKPEKPTALDGSFAIVCKNNKATHPHKADYIATPSQYTISDVQMDDQGYYVTATVTVAPNLAAYNTLTGVEHQLVNEQNATLTLTFRYDTEVTGDENRKWRQQGELPVVEVTCKGIEEPTRDDIFKALNGLVTVTCINRFWKDGNKNMDCGQVQYGAMAGIVGQDYTLVKGEDDTTWVVTFPVTNFVKSFKQNPAHHLYTKDTLSWYIRWENNAWTSAPVKPGVDDLVKLTHAPTDWREVAKIATGGKSDCIHTSCVNSGLNVCDYGITVPFVNFKEDVVSVEPEDGVPGSYIATFKVDRYIDTCAKACNDKNFKDAPRTHKLLTQETVQWRLYATPEADEKIGNNVPNHVWEAEPVKAGKDDVCTIAHNWVVTFNPDNGEPAFTQNVEYEGKAIEPAAPKKTGYTFTDWYLNENDKFDFDTTITSDITLTAKWEAKKANVHLVIYKSGDLSTPIVNVPYTTDKLAGDTIDLAEIDPSSYLDFDFEIDGGWYDDGMFNSYKWYLDGLQEKPAGLEKLLITGNWQNLKLIVTELVPVVYFDSLESLTAYQNDHSKTEGILRTTKARVGSALPTADAPTATRNGYTFTFWSREGQTTDVTGQTVNGWTNLYANWEKKTFTVKYYLPDETGAWVEKKMDTVDSVDYATYSLWTPNAEDGYEFSGWYQKTADIGVKAKVEKLYMAKEWKLYGKFTPIEYTIQYVYNDGKATSTNPTTYTVESDTITLADATGADWGKTFLEWHDENGQKITEIPTGSTGNRVITAYWNWPVHLHYLDKDNNEIDSATLYVSELEPGACVLPTGEKTGYDFDGWYEAKKDIGTASHKLNALSIAKKWELYGRYTAKTDVSYTVKYLREGDNKVLAPEKVVTDQTFDTEVTEQAADVVGYTPDAPSKTMILDEYNKVLTFSYSAKTDVSYTVRYLREGDDKVLAPEKVVTDQTFDTEVTENAADVIGYTPDAPSKTMILDEYNKVLTFSYSAKTDVSYTVRYLREGDDKVLAPEKVVTDQTFDTEVTENAADVIGYTPDAPSKTMILDEYNKVLTFSYSANTYHYEVHYFLQAPDGSYMEKEVDKTPTGVFDTTVTITPDPNRYGAHYSYNSGKSTVSGVVTVDDPTTILKLYVYYDLDFHTLTFDTMGGSKIAPETVRHGLTVAKPKDPVNGGYWFDGWYTDKTYRTPYNFATPLTQDTTIYAKWFLIVLPGVTDKKATPKLNTSDHFAYVQGYPNGTVKPAGNITRAETAAILFRLMDDASRKTYYSTKSGFRDVASGSWYNTYVATLNNAGVITDSSNGYFRPNEAITRAELAAMLAKFSETTGAANYFNDVSAKYWAANAIAICAKLGWITGYPDGTFRPDKNVTRAELMAMINRATGRAPKSADAFLPGMKTWSDNTADKWYYLDVQEATNSHSYTVKGSETWTALTSDPNWSLYE